jgi:hypothetical protein
MADFERIRRSPAHVYTAILAHLVSFNDLSSDRSVTVPAKGTSHSSPAASESAENKMINAVAALAGGIANTHGIRKLTTHQNSGSRPTWLPINLVRADRVSACTKGNLQYVFTDGALSLTLRAESSLLQGGNILSISRCEPSGTS